MDAMFHFMFLVVLMSTNLQAVPKTIVTSDDIENLVSMVTDLKTEISSIRQRVDELENNQETIEKELRICKLNTANKYDKENMTDLSETNRNYSLISLKMEEEGISNEDLPDDYVGFMVRKIPTQQHLSQHQVIEFTEVINNFGNVYDTNFHFFNAPKPGLYYFTCTLTSYQSERLNFELAKNGALVVKGYAADEKQSVCATVSAYLHLEKNDKVWIRNGDNSINSDSMVYGNYYSSFLGFKIQ